MQEFSWQLTGIQRRFPPFPRRELTRSGTYASVNSIGDSHARRGVPFALDAAWRHLLPY